MPVIDRHKHQTYSAGTPTPECLLSYIITYRPYLIAASDKTSNQQMGPPLEREASFCHTAVVAAGYVISYFVIVSGYIVRDRAEGIMRMNTPLYPRIIVFRDILVIPVLNFTQCIN